jgi:hypothetical protein
MKKIPTLFIRDSSRHYVTQEVTPGCEWVLAGEGIPTRKWDGTCVMLDGSGQWWFRREVKAGKSPSGEFIPVETDAVTGKTVGWEKESSAGFGPLLAEALTNSQWAESKEGESLPDTYELVGPKINGNPEGLSQHVLLPHGSMRLHHVGNTPDEIQSFVAAMEGEGIVWWHPDGRKAKLKRKDIRPKGGIMSEDFKRQVIKALEDEMERYDWDTSEVEVFEGCVAIVRGLPVLDAKPELTRGCNHPADRIEMLARIDTETVQETPLGHALPLLWSPICRACGADVPVVPSSMRGTWK